MKTAKFPVLLALAGSFFLFKANAADFPDDAHFFDGKTMRGHLKEKGCRKSSGAPSWSADLVEGKVTGFLMSSTRDNEPGKAYMPQHFSLPVRKDGTFGKTGGEGPQRLWLRWWAPKSSQYSSTGSRSGQAHKYVARKPKYQWVSGKVLKNGDINIHVRFGAPAHSGSFCSGYAYFRNDISDEVKITMAVEKDPELCSGDLKAFKKRASDHIQNLKKAGSISKGKDYGHMDFRLRRIFTGKC